VRWRALPGALAAVGGSEELFIGLHGCQSPEDTFWLDRWHTDGCQLPEDTFRLDRWHTDGSARSSNPFSPENNSSVLVSRFLCF
jgi:hypothetical protein